jgi:hypothetical protein
MHHSAFNRLAFQPRTPAGERSPHAPTASCARDRGTLPLPVRPLPVRRRAPGRCFDPGIRSARASPSVSSASDSSATRAERTHARSNSRYPPSSMPIGSSRRRLRWRPRSRQVERKLRAGSRDRERLGSRSRATVTHGLVRGRRWDAGQRSVPRRRSSAEQKPSICATTAVPHRPDASWRRVWRARLASLAREIREVAVRARRHLASSDKYRSSRSSRSATVSVCTASAGTMHGAPDPNGNQKERRDVARAVRPHFSCPSPCCLVHALGLERRPPHLTPHVGEQTA